MVQQSNLSLHDFNVSDVQIKQTFSNITKNDPSYSDLWIILTVGLTNRSLFPNIRLAQDATYKDYLERWIKGYEDARQNLPSKRKASPKGSCSDPAIQTIVQIVTAVDDEFAARMAAYHNLFMSAENVQGNLLEEYISKSIQPYGWIWCNGNVLRAVDFCSSDGVVLLQIKNKSNTENSSSSAIRAGTNIEKWYRLGTQTQNGEKFPIYKWDVLNQIVNGHVTSGISPNCNMTEESYQKFLRDIASQNIDIISSK